MTTTTPSKVTTDHLKRNAYLYIRQSTLKQVLENTESTKRQYGLQQRGLALGWSAEQIIVIDIDQGQSGAGAADREGFQRLVAEVGLGKAGIVMGLEVSRLARNSMDWHRLLELCAMSHTLILDEDGVYDPTHYNDRLLLGLKGTLSEAELHILRARLRGGIISKAKRGELKIQLPFGFVYTGSEKVVRDPDQRVQQSIFLIFQLFRQTGSARGVINEFRDRKLLFPRHLLMENNQREVTWGDLNHSSVLRILHNPRYAGMYVYGRSRWGLQANGKRTAIKQPKENWKVMIPNAHEAYITQEEYEDNLQRLRKNSYVYGLDKSQGPPREGPGLLQGLVLCGKCGKRMFMRYHANKGQPVPDYICPGEKERGREKECQKIHGRNIDKSIGELLVEMVTPAALEVALAVQQEVEAHYAAVQRAYQQRIEAARYEVNLAKRRYQKVDPDNRLVASTLEAEWNEKLGLLESAQTDYQYQLNTKKCVLSEQQKQAVLALTQNFGKLWNAPDTPHRERKRIVRLLIEDVTLSLDKEVTVQIRFKGGTSRTLILQRPKKSSELYITAAHIVEEVNRLLEEKTDVQIATQLNEQGLLTGKKLSFTSSSIYRIRYLYGLKSHRNRLLEKGWLTEKQLYECLDIGQYTAKKWRTQNILISKCVDEGGCRLYAPLDNLQITKLKQLKGGPTCPNSLHVPQ